MTMAPVFITKRQARRRRLPMQPVGPGRWAMFEPGTDRSWNVYDSRVWRLAGRYGPLVPRRSRSRSRSRRTAFSGFGQVEEIVEEVVEAPAINGQRSIWPQVIAVGAVGFIGLGLLYGMSRASGPGVARYSWGGL